MRQFDFPLVAADVIVHPSCPNCGSQMWLATVEPATKPQHDLRTFECPRCQHATALEVRYR